MKRKIINALLIVVLMFYSFQILTKSNEIKYAILSSFDLWKNNLFPYLFPFFVISDLLISLNFINIINKISKNMMYKLFKINSSSSFVFFMSIISGIPSNAKYINSLIKNDQMTEYEANKIILFTHFCNPLFILGFVGSFLNNKSITLLILIVHYITNFIIGLLFRKFHPNNINNYKVNKTTNSFIKTISSSISSSINTLLLILGVIVFFSCLTTIINLNISSPIIRSIICGIFEITQGIRYITLLEIPLSFQASFITFIISFGGLSSHMQVMSILEDNNIKYIPYLLARLLHAFISSLIIFLLTYRY